MALPEIPKIKKYRIPNSEIIWNFRDCPESMIFPGFWNLDSDLRDFGILKFAKNQNTDQKKMNHFLTCNDILRKNKYELIHEFYMYRYHLLLEWTEGAELAKIHVSSQNCLCEKWQVLSG